MGEGEWVGGCKKGRVAMQSPSLGYASNLEGQWHYLKTKWIHIVYKGCNAAEYGDMCVDSTRVHACTTTRER